jgi:RHS repeat-associated protein
MDAATGLIQMQQRWMDPNLPVFLSVDPVTAYSNGDARYFNRYWYAAGNPYKFTDPDGRSWWAKGLKLVANGGNVAQTFAGVVSDAKTVMNPNASFGERALAAASIASEALPVSVGDAKDIAKGVQRLAGGGDIAKGGTYVLKNADGIVVRTGRTNNLDRRFSEHGRKHPDLTPQVDKRTDDRAAQRGREQIIHDANPSAHAANGGLDKINPISQKNPKRDDYMEAGRKLE